MAEFVEVLDSIMGSNKTNGIIKWMDENPDERYMYVSPLLSEVDESSRLQTDLKYISFEYPENDVHSKSEDLLVKLKAGINICCTHSLYLSMDGEHLREIKDRGYTVIIDEELGVIEDFKKYNKDDLDLLLRNKDISVSKVDGMISWIGADIGSRCSYKPLYNLCNSKAVYVTKRSEHLMVTQLPIGLITAAKRVIIMTYMFEGNILDCFLRLKKIPTRKFCEVETTKVDKQLIRELITLIPPSPELKHIRTSWSGYRDMPQRECTVVANYIRSVCRNAKAVSKDVMYTYPKEFSITNKSGTKRVRPKSFAEYTVNKVDEFGDVVLNRQGNEVLVKEPCWLHSSCRATNKYAFKWCLVHCYDRYPNDSVEKYLQDYAQSPSRNVFATSEICQWVWRSRIRNGKPIVLAIGSRRMYNLFNKWLLEEN